MRRNTVRALCDEHVYFDILGYLSRYQMPVFLPGEVAGEENLESCDLDQEHGSAEDMAGRIGGDADGRNGVCRVVIDGFYARECRKMVGFGVELEALV